MKGFLSILPPPLSLGNHPTFISLGEFWPFQTLTINYFPPFLPYIFDSFIRILSLPNHFIFFKFCFLYLSSSLVYYYTNYFLDISHISPVRLLVRLFLLHGCIGLIIKTTNQPFLSSFLFLQDYTVLFTSTLLWYSV